MKAYITVSYPSFVMISRKHILALLMIITCLSMFQSRSINTIQGETVSHITSSCTIFTVTLGDRVLFGNNEDYKYNNAYRWYMPAQNVSTTYFGVKEIYGAVFFGFDNNDDTSVDTWEQGGMNEHGLCFDANGLPDIELNLDPSASYPYTSHALAQVLWDCKDVEEVITWYENIKWHGSLGAQIHYADSTGDAVVVGVNSTGQWVFTRINSSFIVSTNFDLNNVTHGWYPCNRYETATQMLSEMTIEEDLNVSACADILYAVHQEGLYGTKYSNICDPVSKEFYFCSGEEYSEQDKFNLTEILSDEDFFEETSEFMGVYGSGENLLVNTEQIEIQFETITTTEETQFYFLIGLFGLVLFSLTRVKLFQRKYL